MTIFFPDVSNWQAGIDLSGALAAAVKVSEGCWADPQYAALSAEAARHGAFRLAYHFLRQGNGAAQAAYCHDLAGGTPLMLDFEPVEGTSRPSLGDAAAFTDAYRAAGGTCWWVYLPRWYWQELGSPPLGPLADRGMQLWSSHYGLYTDDDNGAGWQPYGGLTPLAWQYTSTLSFGGKAEVDFSAFRGSYAGRQDDASVAACLAEFRSLSLTGRRPGQPAPPPPVPQPVTQWTEFDMARLPVLAEGARDVPGGGFWHVRRLQVLLAETGKLQGIASAAQLRDDGVFGPATARAVVDLEKRYRLGVDRGVAGPQVWSVLLTGSALGATVKAIGQYAKFLVGAAFAVLTALSPYYGQHEWFPAVSAGLGALLVYLVPNTPKPPGGGAA